MTQVNTSADRKKKEFRKRDLVLLLTILVLAITLLLFSGTAPKGNATNQVKIYQDGVLVATGYLGQKETIIVRGENGEENEIAFTNDGFYMVHSNCKNQNCIEQGKVTIGNFGTRALGQRIICLPNRVIVELVLTDEQIPQDIDIPDV